MSPTNVVFGYNKSGRCEESSIPFLINDNFLNTTMSEVESIVNGRLLTSVSDDVNDVEALTPNHLLLLKAQPSMSLGIFS